jgi:hypothetical protein
LADLRARLARPARLTVSFGPMNRVVVENKTPEGRSGKKFFQQRRDGRWQLSRKSMECDLH